MMKDLLPEQERTDRIVTVPENQVYRYLNAGRPEGATSVVHDVGVELPLWLGRCWATAASPHQA